MSVLPLRLSPVCHPASAGGETGSAGTQMDLAVSGK